MKKDDRLLAMEFERDVLNGVNDVITSPGGNMNLHDLLNCLSSKLYMISINILKDMQDVLVRQVNQNLNDN